MNWPPGWRRCSAGPGPGSRGPEVYDDGRLLVRLTAREVSVGGTPVTLTPTEVPPAGVTALRLAADEHWDLVVTDLDMPGMTGLELLGALRQLAPALPVAVVSAHVLDGAPAGLLGPADRYLEKPLRVDELIATATVLIGRGRPLSDDLRRGNLRAWL